RISPRSTRCCSKSERAFSGFSRSEDASKIVQRDVNASSRANIAITSPNRRTIGWFTPRFLFSKPHRRTSFQLPEFKAFDQVPRARFRAQGVVQQRAPALLCKRRGGHPRDVVAAVQR